MRGVMVGKRQGRWCLLWFQVPAVCEAEAAALPEQEWGSAESQPKELYRIAMKGDHEAVASLGEAPVLDTSSSSSHGVCGSRGGLRGQDGPWHVVTCPRCALGFARTQAVDLPPCGDFAKF